MEDDVPDQVAVIANIIRVVKNEMPREGYYRGLVRHHHRVRA
jgi:hypothetical protein